MLFCAQAARPVTKFMQHAGHIEIETPLLESPHNSCVVAAFARVFTEVVLVVLAPTFHKDLCPAGAVQEAGAGS